MDMTVEVPELPELTFDEASHIYRLNGDIIPSVSKLMEPLKDQCYGGISKRTLENAAIKGSAVHNSIETELDKNGINEDKFGSVFGGENPLWLIDRGEIQKNYDFNERRF